MILACLRSACLQLHLGITKTSLGDHTIQQNLEEKAKYAKAMLEHQKVKAYAKTLEGHGRDGTRLFKIRHCFIKLQWSDVE